MKMSDGLVKMYVPLTQLHSEKWWQLVSRRPIKVLSSDFPCSKWRLNTGGTSIWNITEAKWKSGVTFVFCENFFVLCTLKLNLKLSGLWPNVLHTP
jgi:hypothetical protein